MWGNRALFFQVTFSIELEVCCYIKDVLYEVFLSRLSDYFVIRLEKMERKIGL